MRAWILWRAQLRDERSYGVWDNFAAVDGVIFDEDEALAVERARCVAWARENGPLFLRVAAWSIEQDLKRGRVKSVAELSDDEIMTVFRFDDGRPFVVKSVDVDDLVSVDGVSPAELAAVLRKLGEVMSAFDKDAGAALAGDADAWEAR